MTTTQTNGELHKPAVLEPKWDTMPAELKEMKVWLVWKLEYSDGATKPWTKVPYSEKGGGLRRASTNLCIIMQAGLDDIMKKVIREQSP